MPCRAGCRRRSTSRRRPGAGPPPSSPSRVAIRVGPSRLISTAESSGESNDTVAAEWMTMSQPPSTARSASARPSPSVPTSPAIVVIRLPAQSSNAGPCSARKRSKASFFSSSRCTRRAAGVRLPSRTSRTSSQSGTLRSSRSTSAVPTKPVDPVMAMRLPASDSAITASCLARLYQLVDNGHDDVQSPPWTRRAGSPSSPAPPAGSEVPSCGRSSPPGGPRRRHRPRRRRHRGRRADRRPSRSTSATRRPRSPSSRR